MLWLRLIYIRISKGKNLSIFCNSGNAFRMSPGNHILEKNDETCFKEPNSRVSFGIFARDKTDK